MTMLSSALVLDGPNGVGLQVGGELTQTDSVVSGRQVNVGYIGPGIYNMESGILDVSNLWWAAASTAFLTRPAERTIPPLLALIPVEPAILGGDFNAVTYFNGNSTFHQTGGLHQSAAEHFPGDLSV